MTRIERERIGKFEWEKLLLISPLPFATRSILLMLGVYMSDDGTRARPGIENLVEATQRSRSTVIEHLGVGVETGYLDVAERGGYRGHRYGRRATEYVATVPKEIHARAVELLNSPPWRRSRSPDVDDENEGPGSWTFATTTVGSEGPDSRSEGPDSASERPAGWTPSSSSIKQGSTSSFAARSIAEATARRAQARMASKKAS